MIRILLLACVALTMLATFTRGDDAKKPATFDALKKLEGTWVSEDKGSDGKPDITCVFHMTANGSVLVETMFPGSDHEMVNTYHMNGDSLMMTHYCAQGVQPRLKLVSSDNNVYKFEFMDGTNCKASEGHMGALDLTIKDDKLIENWGYLRDGKVAGHTTFELHRAS